VAVVISALLTVFGLVAFSKLTVREMPDVQTPSVSITTTYEGAAPEVMESQVTKPIEDQLSGISGIKNINSVTRKGRSSITVEFKLGWNMLEGTSDVRDAISRARPKLPDGADEPMVTKDNGNGDVAIWLNFSSTQMDRTAMTDYANRMLVDPLSLVDGVSEVSLSGDLTQVMYVRLRPADMAARGITVADVQDALKRENIELPGGEIRNNTMTMAVQIARLYHSAEDFRTLPVKTATNGQSIYLADIADVEVGAKNEDSAYQRNGRESLGIGIVAQSTANPLAVAQGIEKKLVEMQRFLPEGATLEVDYDSTIFIKQAIDEVYETLAICALLVVAVLYLFLGQGRTTLIPAITVPVSLISAFIGAWYLGFSINLITLLALILAIGLVVDDAIVVVENIHHHLQRGESPLMAAWHGTREVGFAVIATTAVLVMVFVPIAFMDGMVGRLFTEFAILLSLAVLFSSLVALTLTPAMGSWLMRAVDKPNALTTTLDKGLGWVEERYRRVLGAVLRRAVWMPLGCSGYALPPKERCKQTINLVPGDEFIAADSEDGEVNALRAMHRCKKCGTAMDSYVLDGTRKIHICGNNPDCDGYEIEVGQFRLKGYEGPVVECDRCGSDMQLKTGRFGKFMACTNAECKNTRKILKNGDVAPPKEAKISFD
jgi:HAE1 family hydrophobic/amphiphilic exporter-1